MKSNLRDVEVYFQHQTDKAICVKLDGIAKPVWIPKSQCQIDPEQPNAGQVVTLTAPEPVLIEKELV